MIGCNISIAVTFSLEKAWWYGLTDYISS